MQTQPGEPGATEARPNQTRAHTVRHIDEALRSLAPPWVRTGARAIDADDLSGMWPGERAALSRAVLSRQMEFATGRALLRRLIGANVEIGIGPDRRPRLPVGTTGTLAHDQDVAIAAIAPEPSGLALGIDLEPITRFDVEEQQLILRPEERHLDAHLVFVLKEAVYKAWTNLGGGMLDHHDVAVRVDSTTGFTAVVGSTGTRISGQYVAVEGRHIALVVVDRADASAAPSEVLVR